MIEQLQLLHILVLIFLGVSIFYTFYYRYICNEKYKKLKKDFDTLLSHKKSSEVRLGQISEQLAPFLDLFPYDPKKISFLGNPIDYVYFGEDKVVIIEIKSGNSRLSKKQKLIKSLIKGGKVEWDEIRIK